MTDIYSEYNSDASPVNTLRADVDDWKELVENYKSKRKVDVP